MAERKQKAIDVVYVLGTGSNWNNNEIRFSLRSVEKNLKGVRKIWIIGEKPDWIRNINHIQHPDEIGPNNADGNIIRKVLRACREESLTENFLFINDDHLIMKPMTASEIPPYHKGNMLNFPKEYFEETFWRLRLWRTRNILHQKGFKALHFDCHVPLVMNKNRFPEVMAMFDYEKATGYTMKSLYGNVVYPDAPRLNGEKATVFKPYVIEDLIIRVRNKSFVSFNDDGLRPPLKIWLYDTFLKPSKYEIPESGKEACFEIIKWLKSKDKDYETGSLIYAKYGRAKKAKKYFSKNESKARKMKLEHKLKELLYYL